MYKIMAKTRQTCIFKIFISNKVFRALGLSLFFFHSFMSEKSQELCFILTVQLRGTGHETHAKNALEKNACARANLARASKTRVTKVH